MAYRGFAGRCEDGFGQAGRQWQTQRQCDAADGAAALIILPAGADQVAAHDGFDRQRPKPFDDETAVVYLRAFFRSDDRFWVDSGQLVGQDMRQPVEPEIGQLREHLALVRNRVGQYGVEGGKAVAGDDQQPVVINGVNVADLAAPEQRQTFEGGLIKSLSHKLGQENKKEIAAGRSREMECSERLGRYGWSVKNALSAKARKGVPQAIRQNMPTLQEKSGSSNIAFRSKRRFFRAVKPESIGSA